MPSVVRRLASIPFALAISSFGSVDSILKLVLVLEEKVTAPSIPKFDNRVEFGLQFSDELLRTSLMVVWELLRKPSWRPRTNADSIRRRLYKGNLMQIVICVTSTLSTI